MAKARKSAGSKAKDPHPEQALAELGRRLADPLFAVCLKGEERYFRDQGIRLVLNKAKERGDEICRHDGSDPEFSQATLLDDLTSGALFAGARTVVVDNADKLIKKGARSFSQGLVDALKSRIAALAAGQVEGCLILSASNLRADHVLVKAVQASEGAVVGCRRLYDSPPPWDPDPRKAELVQWTADRARRANIPLGVEEAVYVAAALGNDLAGIAGKLEQLRERGSEGIVELVSWESGGSPWDLADKLMDGDGARASVGVEALFAGGFQGKDGKRTVDRSALVALMTGTLTKGLMELTRAGRYVAQGQSPQAALAAAGVRGAPATVKRKAERLASRSPDQWQGMLEDAEQLERRSRSGARVDVNDFAVVGLRWARRRS